MRSRTNAIVALTASQSLTRQAGDQLGGYWISVYDDGGKTFAPPHVHPACACNAPYVVLPQSKDVDESRADRLRLEVAVRSSTTRTSCCRPSRCPFSRTSATMLRRGDAGGPRAR
jgi:hypothetical protein